MKTEWFMLPLYYKQIINNLSAAITKEVREQKKIQEIISVSSQNTVENTALIRRLFLISL